MVSETNYPLSFLNQPGDLGIDSSQVSLDEIKNSFFRLNQKEENGSNIWFEGDSSPGSRIRIKRYPTGHTVFYDTSGRRFLMIDSEHTILHECEWKKEVGENKLVRVRMQLDCRQWVGILPENKTFSTDIDISSQSGWEKMTLDDLRQGASQVWQVPFEEVKYFYKDQNFQSQGGGKYHIQLQKDSLFALDQGGFDKMLFISFMFTVNWGCIDLIPVVELFQSTLPGTGGAVFEFIWGLYEDQNREQGLSPLRYRGLPTYPSRESFNIFSAFFTPHGPQGEDVFEVFMNTGRSHEITWTPRPDPPLRYFSQEHQVTLTVQDGFLYKISVWDDPVAIPFINCARGAKPSCQRQVRVENNKLILMEDKTIREIPLNSQWGIQAIDESRPSLTADPFHWRHFFVGNEPKVDSTKMLYTVPFYPEGGVEIAESSVQPLAMDQIFHYMEESPNLPEKLERVNQVLIHTFDSVIAGCVDSSHDRKYTVLFSDPEFAVKNAQLLWNHAASRGELEYLKQVQFLPESEYVDEAYRSTYDIIFKWIPFMFFHDRENCEAMFRAVTEVLKPGGLLFLVGPFPMKGLFEHYQIDLIRGDPIIDMPFFRQHLKMCPENQINDIASVFLLEKRGGSLNLQ